MEIEDPVHRLCDILHDCENEENILCDSDIPLYKEEEPFEELSETLRDYFETHVQSRKSSPDDTKWFSNLNRFFKYIIGRRVSRVIEWYTQNTAKFSRDNSVIVNGKYTMEQELSNLMILWTLCGLTCYKCGLKCVKNRNHDDDHDCLTDHKCHFHCHFSESHRNKLVPKCNHKAGHDGYHICKGMQHLCSRPCSLSNKRNCQKVCAKEIGHDEEHLCQSKRHYCEATCSLSTKTQGGDYQCPNKCIIPCEVQHDSHRCENETCPIQCPIQN